MIWNWLRLHPRVFDGALALAALAPSLGWAVRHHSGLQIGLALLLTLPLLWRRERPLAVLAIVTVATAVVIGTGGLFFPFPLAIALITSASRLPRRTALYAGGLSLIGIAPAVGVQYELGSAVGHLLPFAAAWLIGDSVGSRRAYVQELEDKAERLEREREQNVRRAAAEEQARIARELHDVIAHNVSVMVVQAAAANDVFDTQPERAREALRAIERTGRSALTELRRLLGTVRTGPEFAPQPGLAALDGLVEGVRAAGLPVELHVEGELRDLPTGLDLSAYRIVQEALTNSIKHAGASLARVDVRRTPDGVELEIVDDGIGNGSGEGAGQGLIGMRERASLVGGDIEAGPQPGGGFRVRARLPL